MHGLGVDVGADIDEDHAGPQQAVEEIELVRLERAADVEAKAFIGGVEADFQGVVLLEVLVEALAAEVGLEEGEVFLEEAPVEGGNG